MAKQPIDDIRKMAFKHLHLIFVKRNNGSYVLVDSEEEGTPMIVDYISFHYYTTKIRVKDIGSNIIYLVDPKCLRNSRIEVLIRKNRKLEDKLRLWFPFLWGEGTAEDDIKYASIIRQLEGLLELEEPLINRIEKN